MMNVNGTFYNDVIYSSDDNYLLDTDMLILCCDVVIILAAVLGIIGNTLLCVCILKTRSLRTFINATLMSALIGNLIACVTLLPLRVYLFTASRSAENWATLCSAAVFFRTFCELLQLFMLVIVSYERFQCVSSPFKKDGRARRTALLIGLSWTVASGLSLLSAFIFVDSPLYDKCLTNTTSNHFSWGTHDLYLIFPFGIGTLLIIIVFYGLIMFTLFKHRKRMTGHIVHRKNKVVPQMMNEDFKGVDKSCSNTDLSVILPRTPLHFSVSGVEKSSKYCETNFDFKNKIDDTQKDQKVQQENMDQTCVTVDRRDIKISSILKHEKTADNNAVNNSVKLNIVQIPQTRSNTMEENSEENKSEKGKNEECLEETVVAEKGDENEHLKTRSPDKVYQTLKIFLTNATPSCSNKTTTYHQQNASDGVNTDSLIQIFDITGEVNRVSKKETNYSGSVCVMNSKSKELGKRKVEARAAKRIAIMIVLFICLWMPLPLTVLGTRNGNPSIAQAQLLVVTATLGMCSVVVNPLLHSILNRQLHASLRNMMKRRKCGSCLRHNNS
ncbi:uncharacterized protein LOC133195571 [Saccostrea echinata]|uniref:uncharacterized protein LOC133195571 n=1 Tax=Saccostrea echinata TaxID=191078 RepID=UPI002A812B37|nr:uncharacterized protein LOC133195571 [Saccostrea echinata]